MNAPRLARALCLAVLALSLLAPATAGAAVGDLEYRGCLSAETQSGPSGSGACAALPHAASQGDHSGMQYTLGVALSPDGSSLYAVGFGDASIATFDRAADGTLTYEGCLTGDAGNGPGGSGACALLPTAGGLEGSNSGLFLPTDVAVSPGGRSVYVLSAGDTAITRFARDPATGALAFAGCVSGSTLLGPSGSDTCALTPGATAGGSGSGLGGAYAMALSPGGDSLYAAAPFDDAISGFAVDPIDGSLSWDGCITGDSVLGPLGSEACDAIPSATGGGSKSGLGGVIPIAVSPDGRSVYAGATGDAAVARFDRDPETGALSYVSCLSGNSDLAPGGNGACFQVAHATAGGAKSGLAALSSLAVSPDGGHLYATSDEGAIAAFGRGGGGSIAYQGCLTGSTMLGPGGSDACAEIPTATADENGAGSGIGLLSGFAISPGGDAVYAYSHLDAAVARFQPTSVGLAYRGCLSGDAQLGEAGVCATIPSATASGLDSGIAAGIAPAPAALVLSPDGSSLYAAASTDTAIDRFGVELPPSPEPEPEPQPQPQPEAAEPAPRVDNRFSIDRLQGRRLTITVHAAGRIRITDLASGVPRRLAASSARAAGPGAVRVRLRLTSRGKSLLRERGSLVVHARVAFVPDGGEANARAKRLRLRR